MGTSLKVKRETWVLPLRTCQRCKKDFLPRTVFSRPKFCGSKNPRVGCAGLAYKKAIRRHYLSQKRRGVVSYLRYKGNPQNTPLIRYTKYKSDAKRRKISFALSFEEFMDLWQKSCSYCGGTVATIGIDRVDNTVGYIVENIVSACGMCNLMKHKSTREQFLDHCEKVVENNKTT